MRNLLEVYAKPINAMERVLKENLGAKPLAREKKEVIAQLLENFNTQVRTGRLTEAAGTGLSDVGPYTKFGINLITAVVANVIADTLVAVQPMTNRLGEVRYLKYKYASTKAPTVAGSIVASALEFNGGQAEYSSETIAGEVVAALGATTFTKTVAWAPLKPGKVEVVVADGSTYTDNGAGAFVHADLTSGTVNYETGAIAVVFKAGTAGEVTLNYEYINTNTNPSVPEIEAELATMPIIAKSRKLKTSYSFDAAFDLQGDYGFDIDAETVAFFSAEIAHEIDGEIMADLKRMAASNQDKLAAWSKATPDGIAQADHDDAFWKNITKAGNMIFKRIKRGRASFIVAGVEVCNVLEVMRKFVPTGVDAVGPHICGYINNIPVIKNPYYGDNEYIVGYKGASQFDTGYIYSPYMPVTVIDIIKPDNFTKGKGFMTAYGKTSINAACYVYGTITE